MDKLDVRTLQVIYFAQFAGATFFAGVVGFLTRLAFVKGVTPADSQLQTVQLLCAIAALGASVAYVFADILYKKVLDGKILTAYMIPSPFARVRTAFIVRIALIEAAAFFGLVACMLAALYGVFNQHQIYFLAGLPYLILLAFISLTFPTQTKLQTVIDKTQTPTA